LKVRSTDPWGVPARAAVGAAVYRDFRRAPIRLSDAGWRILTRIHRRPLRNRRLRRLPLNVHGTHV